MSKKSKTRTRNTKQFHSVCVSMRILADFNGKTEIVDVEPFDSMYSLKLKVLSAMFNLQAHEKDRFVQSAMLHSNGADLDAETLEPKISSRGASKSSKLRIISSLDKEFRRVEDGGDFYVLPHGSEYKIAATNPFINLKASAEISVDGHSVGSWIMEPNQSFAFDRPASVAKKFTFVRTALAKKADAAFARQTAGMSLSEDERESLKVAPAGSGIQGGREENGVVKVKFTPELKRGTTVSDRNIAEGDLINISFSAIPVEVDATSLGLRSAHLLVQSSDTIDDLKTMASFETGIPPQWQHLLFNGKQLDGKMTLASCGICPGSMLHLCGVRLCVKWEIEERPYHAFVVVRL